MSGPDRRVADLSPEQRSRLAELFKKRSRERARGEQRPEERQESRPVDAACPLAHGQWLMWFVHQLAPESAAYNVGFVLRIRSSLDLAALGRACRTLIARHAALRTTYAVEDGQPMQRVQARMDGCFEVVDASGWSAEAVESRLRRSYALPFDLERGPLLRITVLARPRGEHLLLLAAHHISLDLGSIAVLVDELQILYPAEAAGRPVALRPVERDFQYFLRWQAAMLSGAEGERLWSYWQGQLAGELPVLDLPGDRPRPAVQSFRGATWELRLSRELTGRVKELARRQGTTLYTLLLAAFEILIHRYTGQTDVLVGSPMAARTRADLAHTVGCLINFVVLRGDLEADLPFRILLGRLYQTVLAALDHQDYPFSVLTERLHLPRDPGRSPLTGVCFSLDKPLFLSGPPAVPLGPGAARLDLDPVPFLAQQEGQFDLYLEMVDLDGFLLGGLRYSTDLFDRPTAGRMAGHLESLLAGILSTPDRPIGELPLLSAGECQQLLERNATGCGHPSGAPLLSLPALFAAQAKRSPDATAAVCGEQRLSYAELDRQADHLADTLIGHGAGPETVVALLDERGLALLTAMLAVWKAGAAYLPLDPLHPPRRHAQVLAGSGSVLVLASSRFHPMLAAAGALLPTGMSPHLLDLAAAGLEEPLPEGAPVLRRPGAGSASLAYVIYTSGSTGNPKGAMIEHRGMLNHLRAKISALDLTESDAVAQTASQCFDISVWQHFAPLLVGGRVHIFADEVANDGIRLLREVERDGISILETVPSLLRALLEVAASELAPERLPALRWLIPTGEELPPQLCRDWFHRYPGVPLLNAYGPTECSDDVSHHAVRQLPAPGALRVPLGWPIGDTRLYVLDRGMQPRPAGVPGELYVAGAGVGRGYRNDAVSTAAAFVPDPFAAAPGTRLYRTGDLVRGLPGGNLEFLGRLDHQVKVRGFRIELTEIEVAAAHHPAVLAITVLAREDTPGRKRLVAYVVPRPERRLIVAELRAFLGQRLPEYMIPQHFVPLDALPRTANGKLDRRALLAPDPRLAEAAEAFVGPRTRSEQVLAEIWKQALSVELVGVHDNFFELGGDSIIGIQIIARAARASLRITYKQLYQHSTIAELAALADGSPVPLEPAAASAPPPAAAGVSPGDYERLLALTGWRVGDLEDIYGLSPLQEGILFHSLYAPGSGAYLLQCKCTLEGPVEPPRLVTAWRSVLARHPILRTSFHADVRDRPLQAVHREVALEIEQLDWRLRPAEEQDALLRGFLQQDRRRGFDLATAPLLRLALIHTAADVRQMVFSFHHLLLDGWSMGLVLQEVLAACRGAESPAEPAVAPALSYRDFIAWLEARDRRPDAAFWRQALAGASVPTPLGGGLPAPGGEGDHHEQSIFLPCDLAGELRVLAQRRRVTLSTLLRGALALLLGRLSGETDVVFGASVSGRSADLPGIDGIVGLLINTLPVRVRIPEGEQLFTWLRTLQDQEVELRRYEHDPLVEIRKWSGIAGDRPLFEVNFVFENYPLDSSLREPSETFKVSDFRVFERGDLPLTVMAVPGHEPGRELMLAMSYDSRRFGDAAITGMLDQLLSLLARIAAEPDQPLSQLTLVTAAGRHQQLVEWNATAVPVAPGVSFLHLFAAQVARRPEAIAAVCGGERRSYGELDCRADVVARGLIEQGVGAETLVALLAERGLDLLTAVLAIFKAGGSYVPLDPRHPPPHQVRVVGQSGARLLLAAHPFAAPLRQAVAALPAARRPRLLEIEDLLCGAPGTVPETRTRPDNLAYVIFTSGSTGRPKGAMIEHRGMLNHLGAKLGDLALTELDVVAQNASQCFDISVWQLLAPLLAGGCVHIVSDEVACDPVRLLEEIVTREVSVLEVVPSQLRTMLAAAEERPALLRRGALRQLLVTGEALSAELCRQWLALRPDVPLVNAYGPTECSDDVTHSRVATAPPRDDVRIPIGRPLRNTELYVLDRGLGLLPAGTVGELWVGGHGVGRGYLDDPAGTAAAFAPAPFGEPAGARLYRTGDLARFLPDGRLEFLGRRDQQVKIRGFRIELGEVEAALGRYPNVAENAVVADQDGDAGGKRLVAYFVVRQGQEVGVSDLRDFLHQTLPDHLVPSVFVPLSAMPLNENGKIDRRALPAPGSTRPELRSAWSAPRNAVEEILVPLFCEVLKIGGIGIDDSFFELGGHSLLATQIISRVNRAFQAKLPIRRLFESPTIAGMAAALVSEEAAPGQTAAIAQLRKRIDAMSAEEIRQQLRERQKAKPNQEASS